MAGKGLVKNHTLDYLFNSIISLALGFSFFLNKNLFPTEDSLITQTQKSEIETASEGEVSPESLSPISKVPVKKGETIILIPTEEIVYVEAYDNYSFLFDAKANKMLCDYSLGFLEKRLDQSFMRIHRKHIVNSRHIKQIKPHLNGRYLIEFAHPKLETITSSKSYAPIMRKLVKIE
ncbi:MAG: LytTR family DNA-binding domain-containing protein [Bacteroidota bacterium]